MNQIVTIRARRQITLPSEFLSKFELEVGDRLMLHLETNEVKIEPLKTNTVDLLSKIQEVVKKSRVSEQELQESATVIRKKMVKRFAQ